MSEQLREALREKLLTEAKCLRESGNSVMLRWKSVGPVVTLTADEMELAAAALAATADAPPKAKFFADSLRRYCLAPGKAHPPKACGCTICHCAKLLERWGTADVPPETTDWTAAHKTVRVGDAPPEDEFADGSVPFFSASLRWNESEQLREAAAELVRIMVTRRHSNLCQQGGDCAICDAMADINAALAAQKEGK